MFQVVVFKTLWSGSIKDGIAIKFIVSGIETKSDVL